MVYACAFKTLLRPSVVCLRNRNFDCQRLFAVGSVWTNIRMKIHILLSLKLAVALCHPLNSSSTCFLNNISIIHCWPTNGLGIVLWNTFRITTLYRKLKTALARPSCVNNPICFLESSLLVDLVVHFSLWLTQCDLLLTHEFCSNLGSFISWEIWIVLPRANSGFSTSLYPSLFSFLITIWSPQLLH